MPDEGCVLLRAFSTTLRESEGEREGESEGESERGREREGERERWAERLTVPPDWISHWQHEGSNTSKGSGRRLKVAPRLLLAASTLQRRLHPAGRLHPAARTPRTGFPSSVLPLNRRLSYNVHVN